MGYEYDYSLYAKCPCGKGEIREDVYSNDWSQYQHNRTILCPICAQKYHFESTYQYHKTESIEHVYLVPNGKSIHFFVLPSNFYEYIIYHFTKEELITILREIEKVSSSSKINIYKNINIAKEHKRYYNTVKVCTIRLHIAEAIQSYDILEWNYNKICAKEAECAKTERHLLNFQRKD